MLDGRQPRRLHRRRPLSARAGMAGRVHVAQRVAPSRACRSGSSRPRRARAAPARRARRHRPPAGASRTSAAGCAARRAPPTCARSAAARMTDQRSAATAGRRARRGTAPACATPRAASAGRARTRYASSAARGVASRPARCAPCRPCRAGARHRRRPTVVDVEADRLGDARPRRVEQLEQRASRRDAGVSPTEAAASSRSTSSIVIALGSRVGVAGGLSPAGRVGVELSPQRQEAVQPAHGDQGAGGRRRRQGWVVVIPLAQPGEELGDVLLGDVLGAVDARGGEERRPPAQVAAVGRQGVLRGAALDVEVGEPRVDGPPHGGGAGRRLGRAWGQDRASSRVMLSMPNASATAA